MHFAEGLQENITLKTQKLHFSTSQPPVSFSFCSVRFNLIPGECSVTESHPVDIISPPELAHGRCRFPRQIWSLAGGFQWDIGAFQWDIRRAAVDNRSGLKPLGNSDMEGSAFTSHFSVIRHH